VTARSSLRVLCMAPAWNEGQRVARVVAEIPRDWVDEILIVDDGSTDDTAEHARAAGAKVLVHRENRGVGAAIRSAIEYGRQHGFDVLVVVAGGGKTPCAQVPGVLQPVLDGEADFVQGSRYKRGGRLVGAPWHRWLGTLGYTVAFAVLCRRYVSDASSGFRAFKLSLFDDPRIDIGQRWLDRYELEPYLLFKVRRLGHRYREVPVAIVYPPKGQSYTKMRAVIDWWKILRPAVFLALHLRH
jgi:dolichol-phosphate mannosyltransferase